MVKDTTPGVLVERKSRLKRYVGLRLGVCFRRDLGYVLLDDGERLLLIEEDVFDKATNKAWSDSLVTGYPSVFRWFDCRWEAETSFRVSEI